MSALGRKQSFASVRFRPIEDISERVDRSDNLKDSSPAAGESGDSIEEILVV